MYKVPFFKPLISPVKTKFLVDFFSEQEAKTTIDKSPIIVLRMITNFCNTTKKNPQSDLQIEDLISNLFLTEAKKQNRTKLIIPLTNNYLKPFLIHL